MAFIGFITEEKELEGIKLELMEREEYEMLHLILITPKSIRNLQNIKFDTLVIGKDISVMQEEMQIIEKFCREAHYVLVNSDVNVSFEKLPSGITNLITYGFNQKATVTASSVTEENVMVALQRNLILEDKTLIEMGEKVVPIHRKTKVYEALLVFIIYLIYGKKEI